MKLKDYFFSNAKKLIIAILFLFISILISTHIFSWKNKFQLTYNGILGEENAEYYSYEIKNKTNNTLSNVIAVVEVKMVTGKFKIDYPISISMKAGQTKTIKIPREDIKDYAEYYDVYLLFPEINIIKIKYNGKAYDYTISNEIEKFKKQKQIDIVKNIDKKLGGTIDVKLNDLISYIEYYDSIYTTVRGCVASISDDNKELQLYNCYDRSRTVDINLYEKEKNIDF